MSASIMRLLQRRSILIAAIALLLCTSTYLTITTHRMLSTTDELRRAHRQQRKAKHPTLDGDDSQQLPEMQEAGVGDDILNSLQKGEAMLLERRVKRIQQKLTASEKEARRLADELEKCKEEKGSPKDRAADANQPRILPQQERVEENTPSPRPTVGRQEEVIADTAKPQQPQQPPPRGGEQATYRGIDHPEYIIDPKGVDVTPVIIFAYRRPEKLKKCIDIVLRRMPQHGGEFRLFVSQDGIQYPDVTNLLQSYADKKLLTHLIHKRDTSGAKPEELGNGWDPYFAISHHYKFAIGEVFGKFPRYKRLIILEEDIEVGIDFFDMMKATAPLLDMDSTLYCVSGWSDNGKAGLVQDPAALYRSDFFPGLGWMMARSLWEEFNVIWPAGFWDDWMRQNVNRKNRACLRPEVTRTITWCDADPGAVSAGQFCEHMNAMKLIDTPVNWRSKDLSYLLKREYDKDFMERIQGAITLAQPEDVKRIPSTVQSVENNKHRGLLEAKEVKIEYQDKEDFIAKAEKFNLMIDFKEGVPRTAYKGVVTFRNDNKLVHLVTKRRYTDP